MNIYPVPPTAPTIWPEADHAHHKLTVEERRQVEALRAKDAAVRASQQAHLAEAGGLAQSVVYSYQIGPDGQSYAIAGEVQLAALPGGTPQDRQAEGQRLQQAALAPAAPSTDDQATAARAGAMEESARQALQGGIDTYA